MVMLDQVAPKVLGQGLLAQKYSRPLGIERVDAERITGRDILGRPLDGNQS